MDGAKTEISSGGDGSVIKWEDGHETRCSAKWLRFHCQCEKCKPAFSGIYPLDRSEFGDKITIKSIKVIGNELRCTIENDIDPNHVTVIPLSYLRQNCNCATCLMKEVSKRKLNYLHSKSDVPYVKYSETLTDRGMFRCLDNIMDSGFCVLRNAPFKNNEEVMSFVRQFGPVRHSLYGESWQVRSESSPVNAAYTSIKLPSHQDIPMYEMAPGVQVLFALRFDDTVGGGESKMVDLLRCAEILRKKHPDHFATLCRIPASFVTIDFKRDHPAWYEHRKTHIELGYHGEIVAVNWHPNVGGTLRIRQEDMDTYYRAYKTMLNIVHGDENQLVFRLEPGDCFIFNNHRMAHAREAFSADSQGFRHLLGCYTNIDDVKSSYMALADKLGIPAVPKKLSNRSNF